MKIAAKVERTAGLPSMLLLSLAISGLAGAASAQNAAPSPSAMPPVVDTAPASPAATPAAAPSAMPPAAAPAASAMPPSPYANLPGTSAAPAGASVAGGAMPGASATANNAMPKVSAPSLSMGAPGGAAVGKSLPPAAMMMDADSKGMGMGPMGKNDKDLPGADKTPESVKNVINHLSSSSKDVTLEDLNAAREAVATLDALIDIEKRLSDLASIRQDREEKSGKALAGAIPASALGMPGRGGAGFPAPGLPPLPPVAPSASPAAPAMAPMPVSEPVDVLRVIGSDNHYAAVIKVGGATKTVHVGDKLSDGSVVRSISSRGVDIEKDKKSHLVQIKDVGMVFSNR